MLRLSFFITLAYFMVQTNTQKAPEFSHSSPLIPLYLQDRLSYGSNSKSLSQSRVLVGPSNMNVILISPSLTLDSCIIGNDTQTNFQGYHIDLFKMIANELGWVQETDYVFSCVNEAELARRVINSDNVTLAEGGLVISSSLVRQGYKFSQPLYSSGLNILIRCNDPRTLWSFLLPISLKVGLSLIAVSFITSIFIWLFEERNWKRPAKEHVVNLGEAIYDVCSSIYATNFIELRKISSKILQWTFWLVIIIFMAIYQGDLTQKLSTRYVVKEFGSFQAAVAAGKKFGTASEFKSLIKNSDISGQKLLYYSGESLESVINNMIEDLRSHKIDGIVLTNPITEYYDNKYCDIQQLDDLLSEFDYGLMFPPDADSITYTSISRAIIKLTETHRTRLLRNQYLRKMPNADCTEQESISVKELGGLWIILGGAIVFSTIIHLLRRFKLLKPLENYKLPYYNYKSLKTEIFESQLKEAVRFEVNKIVNTYKEQLLEEIEDFENTLLLQEKKQEPENE